ncbi:hypothetical protein ABXK61_13160 [Burkholderia sola]|uniref:hypothetical protein n=1 Tax=Burkholderia TaxID=32008 RepID=UPI001AE20F9F|nr:hypothetical protein [Burkholderia sp. AcTa6-5]MBP0714261.1 hypothetical protein [Burkholderia sp. AcTa6-5]
MTISSHATRQRMPWLRVVAVAWLLALSAGLVIMLQALPKLDKPSEPSPQIGQIDALATRLDQVTQELATLRRQPAPLAPEALAATREALEARLAPLEMSVAALTDDQQLRELKARIEKLEAPATPKVTATPVQRPKATAKVPMPPKPPFQVLGMELRGGERFLTVAPLGSTTAGQMRLLRTGESEGGWTLEHINDRHAMFRVNGQTQQVVVP